MQKVFFYSCFVCTLKKKIKNMLLSTNPMFLCLYLNIFRLSLEDNIQMATVCTLQIAMLQVEGLATTPHPAAWQRQAGPGPACSSRGGTGPTGCAAHRRLLPLRGHQVEPVMQPVNHHLCHHLGEERLYHLTLHNVLCSVLDEFWTYHFRILPLKVNNT
jgi:hypothetical protein